MYTPGIIDEINGLDTLNRYIKDANESPVAKYLRHIASLISGGTASLKFSITRLTLMDCCRAFPDAEMWAVVEKYYYCDSILITYRLHIVL
ncbi:hypothetical protein J6590_086938 [Homalodisca vitripennis]|nr:hypothetical protein J6590_086938 [Homalodisca vitripennis]